MNAVLLRTGSFPARSPVHPGSPVLSGEKASPGSPRISLPSGINRWRGTPIRRALSETGIATSERSNSLSFQAMIPEEEALGSTAGSAGAWPESGILVEELGFSGDGFGKGRKSGGGNGGGDGGSGDLRRIGDYYKKMLKSNPGDPLLLRNYAKYLQEVEGDVEGAEEYYGRAILASPGDAEVLSLYGKLIWDTQRDGERAKSYFDQAVSASPHDCTVLGSYAQFMWEADEEEEEEEEEESNGKAQVTAAAMLAAF